MTTFLSDSKPVARKIHHCDASEFVREYINQGIFTIFEYRQIVKAKRNNWCILPGDSYIRQVFVRDGDFCCFKAIPEMDTLCWKYDLYEDS
jgi:hypothetical protein